MRLFFGLILVLLSGCTSSRFPVLDAVISGMSVTQVEKYFDLSPAQKKEFEESVESDMERLRRERVNEIARSLRVIDEKAQIAGADDKVLAQAYEILQNEYNISSGYFKTSAAKLTSMLSERQFAHFEIKVQNEIAKDRAESVDEKNRELLSRYRKIFKFWAGELIPAQSQSIADFIRTHPFPWRDKINNREQILGSFMAARNNSEKLRSLSEQFMMNYESLRTADYAKAIARYETEFKDFLNKFWTTLSPTQKARMHLSLNDQVQELEKLARKQ